MAWAPAGLAAARSVHDTHSYRHRHAALPGPSRLPKQAWPFSWPSTLATAFCLSYSPRSGPPWPNPPPSAAAAPLPAAGSPQRSSTARPAPNRGLATERGGSDTNRVVQTQKSAALQQRSTQLHITLEAVHDPSVRVARQGLKRTHRRFRSCVQRPARRLGSQAKFPGRTWLAPAPVGVGGVSGTAGVPAVCCCVLLLPSPSLSAAAWQRSSCRRRATGTAACRRAAAATSCGWPDSRGHALLVRRAQVWMESAGIGCESLVQQDRPWLRALRGETSVNWCSGRLCGTLRAAMRADGAENGSRFRIAVLGHAPPSIGGPAALDPSFLSVGLASSTGEPSHAAMSYRDRSRSPRRDSRHDSYGASYGGGSR